MSSEDVCEVADPRKGRQRAGPAARRRVKDSERVEMRSLALGPRLTGLPKPALTGGAIHCRAFGPLETGHCAERRLRCSHRPARRAGSA